MPFTAVTDVEFGILGETSTEVQREDFTVTVGYNVWDNINVFVGYLDGETNFTPEPHCVPRPDNPAQPICNLAQTNQDQNLGTYKQTGHGAIQEYSLPVSFSGIGTHRSSPSKPSVCPVDKATS